VRGEDSALAPSFVGAALGADHRAESIGKIRDSKGKKVEDSNRGFFEISAPTRAVITLEIPRRIFTPLLACHLQVPHLVLPPSLSLWWMGYCHTC
jgi:hypothetical protein